MVNIERCKGVMRNAAAVGLGFIKSQTSEIDHCVVMDKLSRLVDQIRRIYFSWVDHQNDPLWILD